METTTLKFVGSLTSICAKKERTNSILMAFVMFIAMEMNWQLAKSFVQFRSAVDIREDQLDSNTRNDILRRSTSLHA